MRTMNGSALWRRYDGEEEEAVYASFELIQRAAMKSGGHWPHLAKSATRFPFLLARRVVNHFTYLVRAGHEIRHPGALAWAALTDEDFRFCEFSALNVEAFREATAQRAVEVAAAKKPKPRAPSKGLDLASSLREILPMTRGREGLLRRIERLG